MLPAIWQTVKGLLQPSKCLIKKCNEHLVGKLWGILIYLCFISPLPNPRLGDSPDDVCVCAQSLQIMSSNSLLPYGLQPAKLLCPCDFPGKNAGVGCLALPPPGYLPDPGMKTTAPVSSALLADSLPLSHQGSPVVLKIAGYISDIGSWCQREQRRLHSQRTLDACFDLSEGSLKD